MNRGNVWRKTHPEGRLAQDRRYRTKHKEQMKEYQRQYFLKNREEKIAREANYREKRRQRILKLLGGKCAYCGYSGIALEIGHVNNGGAKDRKIYQGARYTVHVLNELLIGSKEYEAICPTCNAEKEIKRRQTERLAKCQMKQGA